MCTSPKMPARRRPALFTFELASWRRLFTEERIMTKQIFTRSCGRWFIGAACTIALHAWLSSPVGAGSAKEIDPNWSVSYSQ